MVISQGEPTQERSGLPMLRIKPGHEVDAQLVTGSPVWVQTHWISRLILCAGTKCPVCAGEGGREVGYIIVRSRHGQQGEQREALLEISGNSWRKLIQQELFDAKEICSGSLVRLSRRTKNSPLTMTFQGHSATVPPENAMPNRAVNAMATLYKLPTQSAGETIREWSDRITPAIMHNASLATIM